MLTDAPSSIISSKTRQIILGILLTVVILIVAAIYLKPSQLVYKYTNSAIDTFSHQNFKECNAMAASPGVESVSAAVLQSESLLRNFTVVTAYLNIGTFFKGSVSVTRNSKTYLEWMWPYRFIRNGVVAYFDDAPMAAAFTELRKGLPTKVIMVDRSKMWAFSLLDRTSDVFAKPDYPKNHPKSTNAAYVAAMNAKYELVTRAVREDDSFGSPYIAWMDLGIYRELPKDATENFTLSASPCLHDDAVMYTRIYEMADSRTVQDVMRNGIDWVGGNFFVARRDVMLMLCKEYMNSVELYLNDRLANHDQSILLAMYMPGSIRRPSVPLQAILPSGPDNPWFAMALQARRDGLEISSNNLKKTDDEKAKSTAQRTRCLYEVYT